MKTIELSESQKKQVLHALQDIYFEGGTIDMLIEFEQGDNDIVVEAEGWVDIDGYTEDDFHCGYMKGTGGWIETSREADITLTAIDEKGERYHIDSTFAKNYLNAA